MLSINIPTEHQDLYRVAGPLRILDLGKRATLKEIKSQHRQLVKRHHSDIDAASELEATRQVNAAYRVVLDYLTDYRLSFAEAEFYEQN